MTAILFIHGQQQGFSPYCSVGRSVSFDLVQSMDNLSDLAHTFERLKIFFMFWAVTPTWRNCCRCSCRALKQKRKLWRGGTHSVILPFSALDMFHMLSLHIYSSSKGRQPIPCPSTKQGSTATRRRRSRWLTKGTHANEIGKNGNQDKKKMKHINAVAHSFGKTKQTGRKTKPIERPADRAKHRNNVTDNEILITLFALR